MQQLNLKIFIEFIKELSCVDLSEETKVNLYEIFDKDMKMYFGRNNK